MKTLDADQKQEVQYCIPIWLRNEQIRSALKRKDVGRIQQHELRKEPCAIVGFAPSLKKTWRQIKKFKYVFTCSGAHKFLVERGITPTWHVEVDPREHKITLLGKPQKGVTYLPASCCHPKYFEHIVGFKTEMWHVFDSTEEAQLILPRGEWAITGGCNVGLRAMTIARFFGFTDQHVFGMDGCEGDEVGKKHAAPHPLQDGTPHYECEYPKDSGKIWKTTPSLLESARQTWHELNMMPDVKAKFYGKGLVQEMAKHYIPNYSKKAGHNAIALQKPSLISENYRDLNSKLHAENLFYGVGGSKHAATVKRLAESLNTTSILDYGCGKGFLAKELPYPIWEYDPAIPSKSDIPRPADIVVCTDVLEHIEPDYLWNVLDDLRRVTKKVGYFVIHTGPAGKFLADGRNSHLIQQGESWWCERLSEFFKIGKMMKSGPLLHFVLGRKDVAVKKAA